MLRECWNHAGKKSNGGGYLITSVRLTNNKTINDIKKAFQKLEGDEVANYVVFNIDDFINMIMDLQDNPADLVEAFGYWHEPAEGTVIEYDKLCMSVFAIRKAPTDNYMGKPIFHFELPEELCGGNIYV